MTLGPWREGPSPSRSLLRDCTTSQRFVSSSSAGWSPVMTFLPLPRTFYKQSELIPRHNHGGTQTNFLSLKNDEWDVSIGSTMSTGGHGRLGGELCRGTYYA